MRRPKTPSRLISFLTIIIRRIKPVWWIVKLFSIVYGALFFNLNHVVLPTVWGCRFIIPKRGFSKYLLLPVMIGLYELDWHLYFDNFIKSARFFIDVGAAADGYYSFRAFRKNKYIKSIAIEPLQLEFEYLVRNVWLNNAFGRIIPLKLALGDKYGEVLINGEKVLMLTLDELVNKLNIPYIDVIKIDVEGAGLSVIKGALKTIRKDRPIIFLEIHNESEKKALEVLKTLLYDFIIRGGRVIAIPRMCKKSIKTEDFKSTKILTTNFNDVSCSHMIANKANYL